MNASQVRARVRKAMKRREEEIEADELESGELNLIPYLDIVTNIIMFLLATISVGLILGHVNTTLPDHAPASSVNVAKPNQDPNDKPLQLVVSLTKKSVVLWSVSGLEGTLKE
ncbi:MAG TPA: hypothetical protein VFG83_10215, partial [Kofleriaceae bacterium]|nr:hypothetical protein [Kofleriaceae bacterium]